MEALSAMPINRCCGYFLITGFVEGFFSIAYQQLPADTFCLRNFALDKFGIRLIFIQVAVVSFQNQQQLRKK